ncbi:MAG: insulinase family protein [Bacteroidetes bacterium]|nr:insulinase family protein [Bacteroidota bacterium]
MSKFAALALLLIAVPMAVIAQKKGSMVDVDIPYKKFTLKNGLTLLVHEDHKAPIVAVNVWYHVGSKNEKPGKSGFAHLFEHLMFNGSENFNDDYFQVLERLGATDLNGTTNEDRTNYFQNVPTSAVDVALWMESDRMGHLLGAITQSKLDEQRGVVQNEKRQGENEPYGITEELITKSVWPQGHPYSWTVIGSMEDLNAASLDDVKEWFRSYYGTANAVLVVAGDIDAQVAYEKVIRYFGDIASGPPVARHQQWVAKRTGSQRQVTQDRVPQARIYKVWNVPAWGTEDHDMLNLTANIMASGKTSRLYKKLVYDKQIATNVSAFIDSREIASLFYIMVTVKPGEDLAKAEQMVDEELAALLKSGPAEKEVQRVRTQYVANFVRGVERIGGFGGKSDILAMSQTYAGDPEHYKTTLQRVQTATPASIQAAAKTWLSDGVYTLEVHPFPKLAAAPVDSSVRKQLPTAGEPPKATFPAVQRATLSNGVKVILAEVPSIPMVNLSMRFDAGYAADQFAAPGTASMTLNMMDEGTKKRSALQISEDVALLGAGLGTGSDLDMSAVSLSTLTSTLDEALDIWADVILNPSFPAEELDRQQKQTLAQIQREKATPIQMALRVFPQFLYGAGHAYSVPFTGSGTEAAVSAMKREDLVKFHETWIRPNNATLVVVGKTTLAEIQPKLEKLFKGWKPGTVPAKNVAGVGLSKQTVYIMDKPGAQQSVILAGHVAPPQNNPNEIAIDMMNTALGGSFTARINMNLRENKHWSYGAQSLMWAARGQRPFIVYAPVQTDKTKESMQEIARELNDVLESRPVNEDEWKKVRESKILELPGSWETMNAIAGSINEIVRFGYADTYFQTYADRVRGASLAQLNDAAKQVVKPSAVVWVVVGDRAKIEKSVRDLGYGEVKFLDGDGKVVE